jgi:hypothetical protein
VLPLDGLQSKGARVRVHRKSVRIASPAGMGLDSHIVIKKDNLMTCEKGVLICQKERLALLYIDLVADEKVQHHRRKTRHLSNLSQTSYFSFALSYLTHVIWCRSS